MIPKRSKVLVITGPTATGKTDLSLKLAKQFKGELVSCDSRQVYLGLDLGAGKYPSSSQKIVKDRGFWLVGGVYLWGYDLKDPTEQFSAFDFLQYAKLKITEIIKRGHLPIIVGGTGLYLKVLLNGLNVAQAVDFNYRARLEQLPLAKLQLKLSQLNPQALEVLNESDLNNKRRLIRKLELANTALVSESGIKELYDILQIGLMAPREVLYQKIADRVDSRLEQGMLEEVETLIAQGLSVKRLDQLGLEYRYLSRFVNGQIADLETLKLILKTQIRNFVKRQLTWFKKQPGIKWFDITKPHYITDIVSQVQIWYHR